MDDPVAYPRPARVQACKACRQLSQSTVQVLDMLAFEEREGMKGSGRGANELIVQTEQPLLQCVLLPACLCDAAVLYHPEHRTRTNGQFRSLTFESVGNFHVLICGCECGVPLLLAFMAGQPTGQLGLLGKGHRYQNGGQSHPGSEVCGSMQSTPKINLLPDNYLLDHNFFATS